MSVDATTLERSALERKDREELTTIAQALGAKPPSRARKAEIVQMILELTGVAGAERGSAVGAEVGPVGNGGGAHGDSAAEPATEPAPPPPPAETEAAPAAAAEVSAPTQEPLAEWEVAVGEPSGADASPSASPGPSSPGDTATDGEAVAGNGRKGAGGGTDTASRADRGRDRDGDDQDKGGPQGADGEQGNRRRRRRGRRGGGDQPQPTEEFSGEPVEVQGLLDLRDEGYGFLRVKGSLPSKDDIYVSVKQARQFGLRKGDHVIGASRPALRNEKNPALLRIDKVNGKDPEQARRRRRFEDLTPLFPDEKLRLERTQGQSDDVTGRIIDLISPIGKGQRGLIVSPPKAGKTTVMKEIVRSVEINSPDVKLVVLLVDERPEEVTDMRKWLRNDDSEVVASTFDRPAEEHTQVAELTIERAKRLVEEGRDVVIILDGITRLARAYNLAAPATGRIMSGGVDSGALYPPKRFFGAARNIEEGGSLTILATALIETGSKMDEVIFEEFKGTGNMELRLDRRLAERRVYPAIDIDASSTRHEELLFSRQQLNLVWGLRRVLQGLSSSERGNAAALELLFDRLKTFATNDEFLAEIGRNRPG